MSSSTGGMIGLYGGALLGLLGWWLGRLLSQKKRGIDELFLLIWQKARATGWLVTLFSIYLFFALYASGVHVTVGEVLSLLLLIHMAGWCVSGVYYSIRMGAVEMKQPKAAKNPFASVLIGVLTVAVFVVVSLITHNWKFFFFSLPAGAVGIGMGLSGPKNKSGDL